VGAGGAPDDAGQPGAGGALHGAGQPGPGGADGAGRPGAGASDVAEHPGDAGGAAGAGQPRTGVPDGAGHRARRRLGLGPLASTYVTIVGLNATEGLIGGIVAPFLADQGYLPAAIGVLVAVEGVVSLLSRLPSGLLYRGRRATGLLRGALAALILVSAVFPFATAPLAFGLARAVQGVAFGLGTTVNFAAFMDLLPARQEGEGTALRGVGVYLAFVSAGFVIGNFLSGFAVDWLGYQSAFWLAGLFSLVVLPLAVAPPRRAAPPGTHPAPVAASPAAAAGPPDRAPAAAPIVPPATASAAPVTLPMPVTASPTVPPAALGGAPAAARPLPRPPAPGRLSRAAALYLEPDVLAMVLLAFIMLVLYTLVGTFFPLYALGVGLALSQVGIVRGLQSLSNTVTRPFTGELSRRLGYRRVGHVGLLVTVLLTSALPLFPHFETYLVVFLLLGLVRGAVMVSNSMMAVDLAAQRSLNRGMVSGLLNAGQDLGSIAGPIVGGLVAGPFGVAAALHALPLAVYAVYLAVLGGLYLRSRSAARQ
jgi:MFS family permease